MNWTLFFTIVEVICVMSLCLLTWFKVVKRGIIREKSIDDSLKELAGFKTQTESDLRTLKHLTLDNTSRIGNLEEAIPNTP